MIASSDNIPHLLGRHHRIYRMLGSAVPEKRKTLLHVYTSNTQSDLTTNIALGTRYVFLPQCHRKNNLVYILVYPGGPVYC